MGSLPVSEAQLRALRSPAAQERPILYAVRAPRETDRMAAQQGYFTVASAVMADHARLILQAVRGKKLATNLFFRFIIAPKQKRDFLRRLLAMNVTARSLFPGVDGLGRSIHELVQSTAHRIPEVRGKG